MSANTSANASSDRLNFDHASVESERGVIAGSGADEDGRKLLAGAEEDNLLKKRIKAENVAGTTSTIGAVSVKGPTTVASLPTGDFTTITTNTATGEGPSLMGPLAAAARQARVDKKLKEAGGLMEDTSSKTRQTGEAIGEEPSVLVTLPSPAPRDVAPNTTMSDSLEEKRQNRYEKKMKANTNHPTSPNNPNEVATQHTGASAMPMPESLATKRKMREQSKATGHNNNINKEKSITVDVSRSDCGGNISKKNSNDALLRDVSIDLEQGATPSFINETVTQPKEMLVEATLVDDEQVDNKDMGRERSEPKLLVVAQAMDDESKVCGIQRSLCFIALLLVVIVGGIVVGVTCGTGNCSADNEKEPQLLSVTFTESPSIAPTKAPTMAPTPFVIEDLPAYSLEALQEPTSPQSLAYSWVQKDPNLQNYSNDRLLQRFALATYYYAANGGRWDNNSGWLSYDQDECTWYSKLDENLYPEYTGNPCSDDYEYLWLTPWDIGAVADNGIPPELGLLTKLQTFDLSASLLRGTIPATLSNLTDLRILWCDQCQLSGTIPTWVGSLTKLVHMGFYDNKLTGPIPTEVGNLLLLQQMKLYENKLEGHLPSELGLLSNLGHLDLETNMFSSTIPTELGNLSVLKILFLSYNELTGPIPSEFGNMKLLEELYLSGNGLTSIPILLGNLDSLVALEVAENSLEGSVEELNFTSLYLEALDISGNEMLTGTIPQDLCVLGEQLSFGCSVHLCGCDCNCSTGAMIGGSNSSGSRR